MLRNKRKSNPTVVPPVSQRSHVGNLRQAIQGKGEIHKRVETAGVYPLVRPRGVSALPATGRGALFAESSGTNQRLAAMIERGNP